MTYSECHILPGRAAKPNPNAPHIKGYAIDINSADLNKAENRVHILNGLKIALDHIDEVIKVIKSSKTDEIAKEELNKRFGLDAIQCDAILEMKLRRLTGLEQDKIKAEYNDLLEKIKEYEAILADRAKVLAIIKTELNEDKEKYGDERKTKIVQDMGEVSIEDLTPNTAMAVFVTQQGYIKRISLDTFERQNRATRGKGGMKTKDGKIIKHNQLIRSGVLKKLSLEDIELLKSHNLKIVIDFFPLAYVLHNSTWFLNHANMWYLLSRRHSSMNQRKYWSASVSESQT